MMQYRQSESNKLRFQMKFNHYSLYCFLLMLFKVTYDKEIHILKSSNVKTLLQLKNTIPKVFKLFPSNFYFTYLDEDGDQITLSTDADYKLLLGCGVKSAKIMIRQKNEDFYDQTQRIQIEEYENKEIQAMLEKDCIINEASQIHSNNPQDKSLDQSIEEKLKSLLPDIISKIKKEVHQQIINQSKISEQTSKREQIIQEPILPEPVVHKGYTCDGCQKHDIAGARYRCSVCHNFDFCQNCQETIDHPHPFLKIKHPSQAPLKIFVVMHDHDDSLQINGRRQPMSGLSGLINHGMNFAQQFMQMNGMPGFNFGGAAQQNNQSQQMKEERTQTSDSKAQAKSETKVPNKTESTINQKNSQKTQSLETKQPKKPVIEDRAQRNPNEQVIIENANYLFNLLELKHFTEAYQFSRQYPFVSKEELFELYINRANL